MNEVESIKYVSVVEYPIHDAAQCLLETCITFTHYALSMQHASALGITTSIQCNLDLQDGTTNGMIQLLTAACKSLYTGVCIAIYYSMTLHPQVHSML